MKTSQLDIAAVTTFRFFIALAIFVITFGIAKHDIAFNPQTIMNFTADIFLIAVFTGSFVSSRITRNLDHIFYVFLLFADLFIVYILHLNLFYADTVAMVLLAMATPAVLPLRRFWQVIVSTTVVAVGTEYLLVVHNYPNLNKPSLIVITFASYLFVLALAKYKFRLLDALEFTSVFTEFNPDPVVETTKNGDLTYANAVARKIFPVKKGENFNKFMEKELDLKSLNMKDIENAKYYGYNDRSYRVKSTASKAGSDRVNVYFTDVTQNLRYAAELESTQKALEEKQRDLANVLKVVSEQKEYSESRSKLLLENLGEGVVITDEKGLITYINPAFFKLTGYGLKDVFAKNFVEAITLYDMKNNPLPAKDRSDAATLSAKGREIKVYLEKKDETRMAVSINASPVFVGDKFAGVVRVMHDISEDVKLAQQKDDFFAIASHELRTPLTIISGNLDNLLAYSKDKLDGNAKETILDSLRSSERLIGMVNDYLNVSRLDQDRLVFEIKPLNPCEVIDQAVKDIYPKAFEKGLKLTNDCPGGKYSVLADYKLLKEVLTNLLDNSIKFTEKGEIRVSHEILGNLFKVTISDTGMGIPEDRWGSLFKRFGQINERTLTRNAGGTGLGLYISRRFVRVMGGELRLETSEINKGSVFSFTLKMADSKELN